MKKSSNRRMSINGGSDWKIWRKFLIGWKTVMVKRCLEGYSFLKSLKTNIANISTLWCGFKSINLYLRTAPQYLQSTRKIGLRALVTRMWEVCLIRTTMASTNWSISTHDCTRRTKEKNLWFWNSSGGSSPWMYYLHHGPLVSDEGVEAEPSQFHA